MDNTSNERDFLFLVRLTAALLLITIAISWRLYAPGFRIISLVPVAQWLAEFPDWINWAILCAGILSLLGLVIAPQNLKAAIAALVWMVVGIAQDINRLDPYICMYIFPIIMAAFSRNHKEQGLNALRIMVCGVYFWAGFHKLNVTFYTKVFPWFIAPLYHYNGGQNIIDILVCVALFITPGFESLIAILLLFPGWRRRATAMAFIMLVTVLICLGPLGHNWGSVVWPWNIYLFILEYRLFFTRAGIADAPLIKKRLSPVSALSIVLYVIAPVLAIYTPWYSYPGFKLYSGNIAGGYIQFASQETLQKAPAYIKALVTPAGTLDLFLWGEHELGNGMYPTPYVFKQGAAGICNYLDDPKEAMLRITSPAPYNKIEMPYTDQPLCPNP